MARDVLEVLRELSRGSDHPGLSGQRFKAWWAEIMKSAPDAFAVTSVLLQRKPCLMRPGLFDCLLEEIP
jgi:hypothetical protein